MKLWISVVGLAVVLALGANALMTRSAEPAHRATAPLAVRSLDAIFPR